MKKTRPQTTLEILQDSYYNMTYKFNKSANLSNEIKLGTKVYYLGEKINTEFEENKEQQLKQNQEYLEQLFKSTIWFTYRRVFPAIENEFTNQDYISDTGWGCMIRCGQMIFAQALRRHLNLDLGLSLENYKDIILAFADDDQQYLSPLQRQQQKQISEKEEEDDNNKDEIQNDESNILQNNINPFHSTRPQMKSENSNLQDISQSYDQNSNSNLSQQITDINNNNANNNTQNKSPQQQFSQSEKQHSSPYSIQKIANKAKEEFKELQQPGQWYNPNRICYILYLLHKHKQMPGAENLEICIMNTDAPIVYETILQKFCGKQAKLNCPCKKLKKNDFKILESDSNKYDNSVDDLTIQDESNNSNIQQIVNTPNCNKLNKNVLQDVNNRLRNNSISSDFIQISKSQLNQSNTLQQITPKQNQNQIQKNLGQIQIQSNQNTNCLSKNTQSSQQNYNHINNLSSRINIIDNNTNNQDKQQQQRKHKGSDLYDGNFEILDENVYQGDSLFDNTPKNNKNGNSNQSNSQNLLYKQIEEIQNGQPQKEIQKDQEVVIIDEQKSTNNIQKNSQKIYCENCHQSDKSVILFIGCKIGLNHPEKKYLEIINDLLKNEYSIGMIGGKPQKALYFPGILGEKYIFLDPHKVQQYTSQDNIERGEQLGTHFCSDLFTIQQDKIDSCLTLGFYLKNLDQLQDFYDYLKSLNHKFQENNFIWIEDTVPYFINTEEDSVQDKNYDQFEINKDFGNLSNKQENQNDSQIQQNINGCEIISSGSNPDTNKIQQFYDQQKNFMVELNDSD